MKKHIKVLAAVISLSIAISGMPVAASATASYDLSSMQAYSEKNVVGGWKLNYDSTSFKNNPDAKAVFLKARKAVTDTTIQPIAFLGSQIVSGRNYCFLCKLTAVSSDSRPEIALVYIYEDPREMLKLSGTRP